MPLELLALLATPQEQVLQHAPVFDRCKWEQELESTLAAGLTIYKHHVLHYFRNAPQEDCIIKITFLDETPCQYWLYKKGKSLIRIESAFVSTKNAAILGFNNNRYVFDGGKTVWVGF